MNRLTSRSAPNGVTASYSYDGLNRLTALTQTAGANTLISNQYQYNDAHNLTNWANAAGNHIYTYDAVDRLTSATNSGQANENYAYDGVGNRTASQLSASYSYQPFNKLTSTATGTYTYDNNGNLLTRTDSLGTTVFSWSEENQLTQVSLPTGLTINYKYDTLGRRIQRTTSAGADERYVYDGQDVLLDLNADWSVATTYLNDLGIDNHLRQTSAVTGISYYLTDHLNSTSGLTDSAGNLIEQISYDSFGNSRGSARTRYTYTGRERDAETGLLYYRARYYDPQAGRFISEDPIGFRGGDINLYAYVWNAPLTTIDPSGQDGVGRGKPLRIPPPFRPIVEPPPTQPPPSATARPTPIPEPTPFVPTGPPPSTSGGCDCFDVPRWPDFYTVHIGFNLPYLPPQVGGSFSFTVDRNWHMYIAPGRGGGYPGFGPGGSITAG